MQQAHQLPQQQSNTSSGISLYKADPEKGKLIQQQLVLLLHADKCQRRELAQTSNGAVQACALPHCRTMKGVLTHMTTCRTGKDCQVAYCASSRLVISHWKNCREVECPVCLPLKQPTPNPTAPESNTVLATSQSDFDPEKKKRIQQQLVLLLHAHKCQRQELKSSNGAVQACVLPHCRTMKGVLTHLTTCQTGKDCQVAHCASSRQIISHWKNCAKTHVKCPVCLPLKQLGPVGASKPYVGFRHTPSAPTMQSTVLKEQQEAAISNQTTSVVSSQAAPAVDSLVFRMPQPVIAQFRTEIKTEMKSEPEESVSSAACTAVASDQIAAIQAAIEANLKSQVKEEPPPPISIKQELVSVKLENGRSSDSSDSPTPNPVMFSGPTPAKYRRW